MTKILIINGPNLNLLGKRNVEVYGSETFEEYLVGLKSKYEGRVEFTYFQSNVEGELIDCLHKSVGEYSGVVLNAGGYTHTSVALADAVEAVKDMGLKTIEVHISNILAREDFRHVSLLSPRCVGSIWGFGIVGYELGVEAVLRVIE